MQPATAPDALEKFFANWSATAWQAGLCGVLSILLGPLNSRAQELPPTAERRVDFVRDVQPILQAHCWSCHGPEQREGGLRLDVRRDALVGGDSGGVIVPYDGNGSQLVRYVAGAEPDKLMPPEGQPLSPEQVGILRAWVEQGADWPDAASHETVNQHWAYQPLSTALPPSLPHDSWSRNGLDRFILQRLTQQGLQPAAEADRTTLIRRLSLDLLGLLPSIEEVERFEHEPDPHAYEALVERLLSSPYFGERWGRHWLDLARYADSDGYEKDRPRPDAYRWRDWVIDAFNADMPFDQFTIEQLAGDLLPAANDMQRLATAFHRQTLTNTEGGTDQEQFRVEACFDRTETTGAVWLGLTVGCARCHTHKYDAITQREYYRLFAFFNNCDEQTQVVPKSVADISSYRRAKKARDRQLSDARTQLAQRLADLEPELAAWEATAAAPTLPAAWTPRTVLPKEVVRIVALPQSQRNAAQAKYLLDYFSRQHPATRSLIEKIAKLTEKQPAKPELDARVLAERLEQPRPTYVLRRGEFLEPLTEAPVAPGGLAVLPELKSRSATPDRLDLAHWLVSNDNPLPPRVAVNHIWRTLFGAGLVRTTNDFGVRGESPTHPELLDWLARQYSGLSAGAPASQQTTWSRKALIRLIVLSATYRQSSRFEPELQQKDPQNLWLARQNRMRVEGEVVRDISLQAAGLLAQPIGGPSVYPPLPPGIAELSYAGNFKWDTSTGADRFRRGMYTFFKRTAPHPNLIAFDCPDANLTCIERNRSNTPLQALATLNNDTFAEAAQAMAHRALISCGDEDATRLETVFRTCLARCPSAHELLALSQLLVDTRNYYQEHTQAARELVGGYAVSGGSLSDNAAWVAVCRVMLNLDEFINRE